MINKKILSAIMVFALTALLAMTSVNASSMFDSYPADIHAEGKMTLRDVTTAFETELNINTNFTALVPFFINPGAYDVNFIGRAIVSDDSIKFKGLIAIPSLATPLVRKGNFWVNFRVEKPEEVEITDRMYIATGELSITISRILSGPTNVVWVHLKGLVTSYGGKDSYGGIMAHAKIGEWARVHGFFTQQALADDTSVGYTFSFFAFRLVNTTEVELNHDTDDLYISGLWNVYNVTWTHYDHDWTLTVEQITGEGYGELKVAIEPEAGIFTLRIEGLELIEGKVIFYHIRYCGLIEPTTLPIARVNADYNGDWEVNMLDVTNVAKRYGATIGKPRYNFFLDVNFDYVINILDLASVAQQFGQEY